MPALQENIMPSQGFSRLSGSAHVHCHPVPSVQTAECLFSTVRPGTGCSPEHKVTHKPVTASWMWTDTRSLSQRRRALLLRPRRSAGARARSVSSLCAPTRGLCAGRHVDAVGASRERGTALGEPAFLSQQEVSQSALCPGGQGCCPWRLRAANTLPRSMELNGAPPER